MKKRINSETGNLRQKAEELLKKKATGSASSLSEIEMLKLIHELDVHQIELEILNDELMKANESMAKAATDKYAELYDFAPTGYFTISKQGKILELNLFGAAMLGRERLRLINKQFHFFISVDDKPVFNLFLDKIFNSKSKETCELTLQIGAGVPIYVLLTGIVNQNDEQCLVTMVDITDHKLTEALLQQTRQNYETFFNTIDEFLLVLDEQGNIIHANSTVFDRLGYTWEELSEKSVLMLHPPESRDEAGRILSEMLRGLAEFCLVPIMTKSGVQIPVETRVSHGFWNSKPAVFGVSKDISKIKLSEEKFSKLFHLNPFACGLSDLDNQKYIEVNEVFYSLFGFDKDEVIGKTAGDLGILSNETINDILQKADRNGRILNAEADLKAKNGDIRHVLLSAENICIQDKKYRFTVVHDITERKLTEISLRQSEEKFRITTENTIDVIALLDMDFNITYLSPSVEKIRGYTVEEAVSQKLEQILTPASLQKFLEMAGSIIPAEKAGTAQVSDYPTIELEQYHKNGTTVWVELSFSFLKDLNNKSTGIVTVSRDVTKRKLLEESLQQSEERYRTMVEWSPYVIVIYRSGKIIYVNPQAIIMFGAKSEQDLLGTNVLDRVHPDCHQAVLALAQQGVDDGVNAPMIELRYLKLDGTILDAEVQGKLIVYDRAPAILAVIYDITDRKIAEQVIRVSEEKFRSMLNASPDGMVLIDLKGVIIEASVIGLNLFGADARVDMVGRNISQFVSADETGILNELLAKTTDEGLTQNTGLTIKRKDQSVFTGEISATLMQDQNGAPISFMIIVRDISQRKKMEAKQIHTDRMSTLGEMAAGIAHEINQPLNIISMVMDKILFETARKEMLDMEFLKNKSDKIFENITRIRDIIDHVRAFARSQDDYIPTAFNVNSSIVNASSMIVEQFKHHGINLNLQLEPKIPQIVGNTYKFEQVILNLLANAKDAVIEKHSKKQDVEMLVGIRSWHENQCIFVDVTDNGTGISKDDINNVLLPFFTTKEEGKGTGLGLSICYQIMKEMKGTIEITSDSMLGTRFQLVLPLPKKK